MKILLLTLLAAIPAETAPSTTWAPEDFNCTICGEKNTFMVVVSYGGYIYGWDSKFQYIFWPLIDDNVVYSCRKCRLTCFMWDFEKIPKEKFEEIGRLMKDVKLDAKDEYSQIPMSQRLAAAEKVYGVLGRTDEEWCRFYRVKGYHLAAEKKEAEAKEARKKALEIALKMIEKKDNAGIRKELLLITGAMRHFLDDDAAALKDFEEASKLTYECEDKEKQKNLDAYLTELLGEYQKKLKAGNGEKPEEK